MNKTEKYEKLKSDIENGKVTLNEAREQCGLSRIEGEGRDERVTKVPPDRKRVLS